jgi:hypothetical protein
MSTAYDYLPKDPDDYRKDDAQRFLGGVAVFIGFIIFSIIFTCNRDNSTPDDFTDEEWEEYVNDHHYEDTHTMRGGR